MGWNLRHELNRPIWRLPIPLCAMLLSGCPVHRSESGERYISAGLCAAAKQVAEQHQYAIVGLTTASGGATLFVAGLSPSAQNEGITWRCRGVGKAPIDFGDIDGGREMRVSGDVHPSPLWPVPGCADLSVAIADSPPGAAFDFGATYGSATPHLEDGWICQPDISIHDGALLAPATRVSLAPGVPGLFLSMESDPWPWH